MTRDQALKLKVGQKVRYIFDDYPSSQTPSLKNNEVYTVTGIDVSKRTNYVYILTNAFSGYAHTAFDVINSVNKMRGDYE